MTSQVVPSSPFAEKTEIDVVFKYAVTAVGVAIPLYMLYLYLSTLIQSSMLAIQTFGMEIFTNSQWDPVHKVFGVFTFIYGTIVTTLIGIVIALPLSILASIFIYEYVPEEYKTLLRSLIDLLAGIPSVIYGLWGIFVLIPLLKKSVFPLVEKVFNLPPIATGNSLFTAGLVIAIMIIPILINIIIEGFDTVPVSLREAMIGLGATRWEVSRYVTVGTTKPTIFVALMLGLGRALGETMAVTMVIGNSNRFPGNFLNIFAPGQTISSLIANEFAEASGSLYMSVIFEIALILFLITAVFNTLGILILRRMKHE